MTLIDRIKLMIAAADDNPIRMSVREDGAFEFNLDIDPEELTAILNTQEYNETRDRTYANIKRTLDDVRTILEHEDNGDARIQMAINILEHVKGTSV
jgi:hypothetical protein